MAVRSSRCRLLLAFFLLLLLGYYAPAFAGNATLTWDANTEADLAGYRVYVGLLPGVYAAPVDVGKATSWTGSNLTAGVTYYFAVTAYNTAGLESKYSNEVSKLIPPLADLIAPLLSSLTASNLTLNSATLTWSTDEPADTQIQYGSTTAYGLTTPLVSTLVTAHSQTLTGLLPGTLYHYRVLSRDAAGNLATSADNTFTTAADTAPPSIPGNVVGVAISTGQITLSWTASTDNVGVTGYRIYRGGAQVSTTTSLGYTDAGLSANTAYSYRIAAYDAAGNLSAQSPAISVTTPPLAPVVSQVTASNLTSTSASLSGLVDPSGVSSTAWFEYGTTTAYGSTTPAVSLLAANTLSAPLSALAPQTLYHFRLVARNAGGTTASLDSFFTTPAPPAAVPPPSPAPAPNGGYTLTSEPYAWVAAPTTLALSGDDNTASVSLPFSFPFYNQSYTQLYVSTNGLITFGAPNSAFTPQPIPSTSLPNGFIAPFWRDLYVGLKQISYSASASEFVVAFNGVRDLCCSTTHTFEVILRPDGTILLQYGTITPNAATGVGIESPDGIEGIAIPAISSNSAFKFSPDGYTTTLPPAGDTTAPTIPGNLLATVVSSTQVNLSWTASTDNVGVAGYRVYRNGAQIGTAASPSYSDSGLTASTTYSYTVSAYDAAGNASAQSAAVSAGTLPPPDTTPPVISGMAAGSLTASGALISWSTNEPADTQVEYGTTATYGAATPVVSALTTAHSQSLSGLLSSTLYHYRVKSKDAAGNLAVSADSTFTTAAPPDTSAPSAPSGLAATAASSSQINLSWVASTDNVGVTGYRIYRNGTQIGTATLPTYSDGALSADTSYSYTVAAYDAAGNLSAQSAAVNARTLPPPDTTPPILSAISAGAITGSSASISWTTNEAATTQIQYGTTISYGLSTPLVSTPVTAHSQSLSALLPNTLYHYRVLSSDAAGNLATSGDNTFTTAAAPDTAAPSVPNGLTAAAASASQINLAWTASIDNVGVTGYRVYRNGAQIGTTVSPAYLDAGLAAATTYSYTVSAYDAAGNASAQSTAVSISTSSATTGATVSLLPIADTFINLDTTLNSQTAILNTYTWPANKVANTVLMKFDLSSLPAGAVIQSATLNLALVEADATTDATYTVTVHKMINKNPDLTRATGFTYDGTNGWTANPCCDSNIPMAQADISAAYDAQAVDKILGYKNWNVTALVQEWVNSPAANYGLVLNSDTTKGADRYRSFASMENPTTTLRPYLNITYVMPDTTPPVISNVASGGITLSGATITWTTNEAATSQVEYGTTTAYGSLSSQDLTLVSGHSSALSGLLSSTLYHYRVRSKDAAGNLAVSADSTFTTAAPPDTTAPVLSAISAGAITSSSASISWTTNEPATTQVEYGITTAYGSLSVLNATLLTTHSVSLTGLTSSKLYHYRVISRDAAGNAATSVDQTFTTPAPPDTSVPSVPIGLVATAISSSQINLSWTASTDNVGVAGYRVYRNGAQIGTAASPSYSDSGLTASTTYSYTVSAYDAAGNASAQSTAVSAGTLPPPDTAPPVISGMAAGSLTASGALISWSTNEPADTQVEYGTTAAYGAATPIVSALTTAHSQSLSGLLSSTLYHYRVKSKDAAGNLAVSADSTFTTAAPPDTSAPSAPSGLAATAASSSQINLSWVASTDNVGVTGYRIYRNGIQVGTTASPSYADAGLTASTTYNYTVSAYDAAGNVSAQSTPLSAATLASSPSTTVVLAPTADTFLNIDSVVNSGTTTLNTYTWPANKVANAVLMKFALSALPAGAVIQSATLNLALVEADATTDATYTVTVHKVINKNPDLTRATGFTYDGTNGWTANPCCDSNIPMAQADISAAYASRAVDKVLGGKTWDIMAMVQEWVNSPATNYGLLLNSDATKGADRYRYFASMEHPTTALRPSLSITYRVP